MRFMRVTVACFAPSGCSSTSSFNRGTRLTRTSKTKSFPATTKLNVETIVKFENKIHQELSSKPITRALLEGLFLEDASQMRQEIYARHGKVFKEPWLQKYFSSFDWYKADPNFTDAALTEVEKKNIATIAAYEKRAVTAMSTIEG